MINPDVWVPIDGMDLEPNAMVAVKSNTDNAVVTAGPGAGKTELLAQRADFLFRTGACPYPQRILAVSFKVDAARNLRDRVRKRSGPQYAARFDSFTFHAFAKRIIDNYRPALTGPDALDPDYRIDPSERILHQQITFKDIIPLALDILRKNRYARGGIRQAYSHVFFDEFQDATDDQYDFVKEAFGESSAHLTAVGDVKQRIMGWAGALDGVMKTFAHDFDATTLPLYQNFRSAPRLRRMQNRMIADMDPSAVNDDENLHGDNGVIEVYDFESDDEEAKHVADVIQQQLDSGTSAAEIAVLIRQQPHLIGAALFAELAERGIPYRNEQTGQDLAAEPAAALVFNFIRVVADDHQPSAYSDLMRVASRHDALEEDARRTDRQFKRLLQDARATLRASPSLAGERAFWHSWIDKLFALISRPVLLSLSSAYVQGPRFDDLINQALQAFEAALRLNSDPVRAVHHVSGTDAVRILTIHKCKGLEFEHVVLLGVENEAFFGDTDEAAATFFVGISRAKTQLTLTWSKHRRRPAGHKGGWKTKRSPQETFLNYGLGG